MIYTPAKEIHEDENSGEVICARLTKAPNQEFIDYLKKFGKDNKIATAWKLVKYKSDFLHDKNEEMRAKYDEFVKNNPDSQIAKDDKANPDDPGFIVLDDDYITVNGEARLA